MPEQKMSRYKVLCFQGIVTRHKEYAETVVGVQDIIEDWREWSPEAVISITDRIENMHWTIEPDQELDWGGKCDCVRQKMGPGPHVPGCPAGDA